MHSNSIKEIDGTDLKVAIVRSRFNESITQSLLDGSLLALKESKVKEEDIKVFTVPGSFELPLAAKKAALTGEFDCVICLGAVIKGDTPHFDYVSQAVTAGIVQVNLETEVPVIFGIITTLNMEQALERSKPDKTNKGYEVTMSGLETVKTIEEIEQI